MRTSYNPCFCIIFLLILTKIAFNSTNFMQGVRISTTLTKRAVCYIFNTAVNKLTYLIFDCRIWLLFFLFPWKKYIILSQF